jgi:hypothetical protein
MGNQELDGVMLSSFFHFSLRFNYDELSESRDGQSQKPENEQKRAQHTALFATIHSAYEA